MKLASNPQTTKTADFPSSVLTSLRSTKETSVFPSKRSQASHGPRGTRKAPVPRDGGATETPSHVCLKHPVPVSHLAIVGFRGRARRIGPDGQIWRSGATRAASENFSSTPAGGRWRLSDVGSEVGY